MELKQFDDPVDVVAVHFVQLVDLNYIYNRVQALLG